MSAICWSLSEPRVAADLKPALAGIGTAVKTCGQCAANLAKPAAAEFNKQIITEVR